MLRLEEQESAEYYKWLLWIEKAEFEKELLEIVSLLKMFQIIISYVMISQGIKNQ